MGIYSLSLEEIDKINISQFLEETVFPCLRTLEALFRPNVLSPYLSSYATTTAFVLQFSKVFRIPPSELWTSETLETDHKFTKCVLKLRSA